MEHIVSKCHSVMALTQQSSLSANVGLHSLSYSQTHSILSRLRWYRLECHRLIWLDLQSLLFLIQWGLLQSKYLSSLQYHQRRMHCPRKHNLWLTICTSMEVLMVDQMSIATRFSGTKVPQFLRLFLYSKIWIHRLQSQAISVQANHTDLSTEPGIAKDGPNTQTSAIYLQPMYLLKSYQ